jgi:hypothetical protein
MLRVGDLSADIPLMVVANSSFAFGYGIVSGVQGG